MGSIFLAILKTARPRQWLKNLAIFATILFTGHIFEAQPIIRTAWGFGVFCLLSSSNYVFNDIMDAPRDRKHPYKKFRPVASGQLPVPIATVVAIVFAAIAMGISYWLGHAFFILSLLFGALEYSYTVFWKHISVIDILAITAAYFLRVYAGEALTGFHISVWLALAAFSLALFLAIGKRRAELTLVQSYKGTTSDTRATLLHYSEKLLDTYTAMFANSTFITYAFYTFLERPVYQGFLFKGYSSDFTLDLTGRKWLMISIPFVLYGIMRYMQLIYEGKGESPEKVLLSDKPLLITIFLWVASVFVVIYGIGG